MTEVIRETGIFSEKLVDDVIANNDYCVDLFKSHAVLAYTGSNSWYSVVESVYISEPDNSFIILTKNCQTENVSTNQPIYAGKRATFRELVSDRGNFVIRSGSGIHHPLSSAKTRQMHYHQVKDAFVCLRLERARQIAFEDLRNLLLNNHGDLTYLHVRFDWRQDGQKRSLISRCEYLNFNRRPYDATSADQNLGLPAFDYVQPTCGEVCIYHDGRHRLAYVAALVGKEGVFHCELILEDEVSYMDTKRGYLGDRSHKMLTYLFSPLRRFLMTDYYTLREKINAVVSFYVILPQNAGKEIKYHG